MAQDSDRPPWDEPELDSDEFIALFEKVERESLGEHEQHVLNDLEKALCQLHPAQAHVLPKPAGFATPGPAVEPSHAAVQRRYAPAGQKLPLMNSTLLLCRHGNVAPGGASVCIDLEDEIPEECPGQPTLGGYANAQSRNTISQLERTDTLITPVRVTRDGYGGQVAGEPPDVTGIPSGGAWQFSPCVFDQEEISISDGKVEKNDDHACDDIEDPMRPDGVAELNVAQSVGKPFISPVISTHITHSPAMHVSSQPDGVVEIAEGVTLPKELAMLLRPHQTEGVVFLVRSIQGKQAHGEKACILADAPGLGKSAQTIATIRACEDWCKKVVILAPASLIDNWIAEFRKWGGRRALPLKYEGAKSNSALNIFCKNHSGSDLKVLMLNYEKLRNDVLTRIVKATPHLVVCDEAHRLKNRTTKEYANVSSLLESCISRILVTATPVQNNPTEFCDMVNLLRIPFGSSNGKRKLGSMADESTLIELSSQTSDFLLRRGPEILQHMLPPRRELVVFCKMCDEQQDAYVKVVEAWESAKSSSKSHAGALQLVTALQRVTSHPSLADGVQLHDIQTCDLGASGKLRVVRQVLESIEALSEEKVVITSNQCYNLDLLQRLCTQHQWKVLRVDGGVSTQKRQSLVDEFNRGQRPDHFVFLLSAKAGGAGLNLVGATRLVLFDPDWNPAVDAQVCGRIWRIGQARPVIIMRLVGTSTIEELIIQRQMHKGEISELLVDKKHGTQPSWTPEELAFAASYDPQTVRKRKHLGVAHLHAR